MIPLRLLAVLLLLAASASRALAQSTTAGIVKAAHAFLASLDGEQRKNVTFAFDDQRQRARWSNFPVTMVRRAGLPLRDLNETQRAAAMALLAAALSPRGYQKVREIMDGDELLRRGERDRAMFGKDLFYFSLLGKPSEKEPWMLQFGGHHLALNLTIVGAEGILTPSLTAAQPALYQQNGRTVRPLGAESDKAFALLESLDAAQRQRAVLDYRVADLVLGPGQDGKTIQPEGLPASAMNERQRALLLDVIAEWTGIVHERAAAARLTEIKAGLGETWFAWSGPVTRAEGRNITAYYRIQGPKLVIEYAPQRMGGDPGMHVHTIYRDPTNDYGRGSIAAR